MIKVTIKDKEYNFGFRSIWGPMYSYELLQSRLESLPDFDPRRNVCLHTLYYCILAQENQNFDLKFDDYMLALNDMELVNTLNDAYTDCMQAISAGLYKKEIVETKDDDKKKD